MGVYLVCCWVGLFTVALMFFQGIIAMMSDGTSAFSAFALPTNSGGDFLDRRVPVVFSLGSLLTFHTTAHVYCYIHVHELSLACNGTLPRISDLHKHKNT